MHSTAPSGIPDSQTVAVPVDPDATDQTSDPAALRRPTIGYGFLVRASGSLTQSTFGLFSIPVALTLGVPSVAVAFGIFSFVTGVCAPLIGWLVDRTTVVRTQRAGAVLLVLGLVGSSLAEDPWHFYVAMGVLCGVGVTAFTQLPINIIVTRLVRRRLLPAFGIVTAGAGLGGLLAVPATERVINEAGWRVAYLGYAAILMAIWLAFDRWIRSVPKSLLDRPARRQRAAADGNPNPESDTRLITRGELQVVGAAAFSGAQRTLMVAFFIPWSVSRGVSLTVAAQAFALAEGLRAFSGVGAAYIGSRFGSRSTYITTCGLAAVSAVGLFALGVENRGLYFGIAAIYGLASGGIHPASSSFQSEVYRSDRLGFLFGSSSAAYGVGGALFVVLAERLSAAAGLDAVLLLVALGLVLMAALVFGVRPSRLDIS